MTNTQQRILDAIPYGSDNAVKASILAAKIGFDDDRIVRKEIHQMRLEGKIIASSTQHPYGYFIPVTAKARDHYFDQIRSRRDKLTNILIAQEHSVDGEQMRMGVGY
jgi:hypothetical protein